MDWAAELVAEKIVEIDGKLFVYPSDAADLLRRGLARALEAVQELRQVEIETLRNSNAIQAYDLVIKAIEEGE